MADGDAKRGSADERSEEPSAHARGRGEAPRAPPGINTCIVLRLRRVIVEDAYVGVPVSEAIMKREPEPDGTYRLDFDAFVREGIRLSADPRVDWRREDGEPPIEIHPTQGPVPDGRTVFDVHRIDED
jgi:hypothetical protein